MTLVIYVAITNVIFICKALAHKALVELFL